MPRPHISFFSELQEQKRNAQKQFIEGYKGGPKHLEPREEPIKEASRKAAPKAQILRVTSFRKNAKVETIFPKAVTENAQDVPF